MQVDNIFKDIQKCQAQLGKKLVSFPPRTQNLALGLNNETYILFASFINACSSQQIELFPCDVPIFYEENTNHKVYLKSSNCFRIGAVGIAAATPPEEIALRKLMEQDNAVDSLVDLFEDGSQTGKLYALLGLRFLNHSLFDELATQIKNRSDNVDRCARRLYCLSGNNR